MKSSPSIFHLETTVGTVSNSDAGGLFVIRDISDFTEAQASGAKQVLQNEDKSRVYELIPKGCARIVGLDAAEAVFKFDQIPF